MQYDQQNPNIANYDDINIFKINSWNSQGQNKMMTLIVTTRKDKTNSRIKIKLKSLALSQI